MPLRLLRLAGVLAGVALFSATPPASAAVVLHLDLPALTARADLVVRGRAVAQRSRWDAAHRRIYTDVTLVVDEAYKGGPRPGSTLRITRLGGSVDGIGMRVAGEATFALGEEAIVFLRRHVRHGVTRLSVLGMAQGKLTVLRGRAGARVLRSLGGAGLRVVAPSPRGRVRRVAPRPISRSLADFERELRTLVAHPAALAAPGTVRP
jgi:hypothetical protein